MTTRQPSPMVIDTPLKLAACVVLLRRSQLLAIDTESNSLHAYQEQVCLIQISTREDDFIIDPLALDDLSPLAELLADERIEKVFHAAEYDLMCLKRDYGFTIRNLFDTMIAARVCGLKETGLGSLVQHFFDIQMDKSHQRDDWGARPLSNASLIYAQMDTHYLPMLRDHLDDLLQQLDRYDEAQEWFQELGEIPPAKTRLYDEHSFWRLALPNQLTPAQSAVMKAIYDTRERLARQRDVPPFKILSDSTLVHIARQMPESMRTLRRVQEFNPRLADRYGNQILAAILEGLKTPPPPPPPPEVPAEPAIVERYTALREWRKLRAAQRGVEADVIASKDALWTLSALDPRTLSDLSGIRGFGTWRKAAYGEDVLAVLRRFQR